MNISRQQVLDEINEHLSTISPLDLSTGLRAVSLPFLMRLSGALNKMKEQVAEITVEACREEDR